MTKIDPHTPIRSIEFGIILKEGREFSYYLIPTDSTLKAEFQEMLEETQLQWQKCEEMAREYDPAEIYPSRARLELPSDSFLLGNLSELYNAENIPIEASRIQELPKLFAYFCIFRFGDVQNREKILAIRKAVQFKGLAKQRLVQWFDDSLHYVEDKFFKLDKEFDIVVTPTRVMILKPKSFESIARLDDVILETAGENLVRMSACVPYIEVSELTEYAKAHKRAARLIASIVARGDLVNTSERLFKEQCARCGVPLVCNNGKVYPAEKAELAFLNVLDRRRYTVSLIEDTHEKYEATSRHGVV